MPVMTTVRSGKLSLTPTRPPLPRGPRLTPTQLARYFYAKLAAEWGPHNLKNALEERKDKILVLDVRSREGFKAGHIRGAKNIPQEELDSRWKELPRDQEIVAYCWSVTCHLSTQAAAFLAGKGYRVKELVGGIAEWQAAEFPTEK